MATSTIADINTNARSFISLDFQDETEFNLPFFNSKHNPKKGSNDKKIPAPYKMADLPLNKGATNNEIELPIILPADGTEVQAITETGTVTAKKGAQYTNLKVTLAEYASRAEISLRMEKLSYFNHLKDTIRLEATNAAIFCNAIIIAAMNKAPMALTAGAITAAGGFRKALSGGAANHAALYALSNSDGKLNYLELLQDTTLLGIRRAAKTLAGGGFIASMHSSVAYDLKSGLADNLYTKVLQYQDQSVVVTGEVGMIAGARIVETNFGLTEAGTANTPLAAAAVEAKPIYSTFIMGVDAYSIPKLAGTPSPLAPNISILDDRTKSDPHNRWAMLPWEIYFAAAVTHPDRGIQRRSHATLDMSGYYHAWPTAATLS